MYTVKQLSDLAGVSVRTLHYYDEIALLNPSQVRPSGYRYYNDAALLRLQQILFYREIGLELTQIKEILDSPDFDLLVALRSHRSVLKEKVNYPTTKVGGLTARTLTVELVPGTHSRRWPLTGTIGQLTVALRR